MLKKISIFLLLTSCNMLENTNDMLGATIEVQEKIEKFTSEIFDDLGQLFTNSNNSPESFIDRLESLFFKRYLDTKSEKETTEKLFYLMQTIAELTKNPFTNGESK